MKLYTVIYRVGGSARFSWRATSALASQAEAAERLAGLTRMGYRAVVKEHEAGAAVALPSTFVAEAVEVR